MYIYCVLASSIGNGREYYNFFFLQDIELETNAFLLFFAETRYNYVSPIWSALNSKMNKNMFWVKCWSCCCKEYWFANCCNIFENFDINENWFLFNINQLSNNLSFLHFSCCHCCPFFGLLLNLDSWHNVSVFWLNF